MDEETKAYIARYMGKREYVRLSTSKMIAHMILNATGHTNEQARTLCAMWHTTGWSHLPKARKEYP